LLQSEFGDELAKLIVLSIHNECNAQRELL